jgi:hypothetical protein
MAARQITVREPLLKTGCVLGEGKITRSSIDRRVGLISPLRAHVGPVWDPQAQTLHFVDIDKHKVYHYHPETSDLKIDELDEPIGCLVLRKNRNGVGFSTLALVYNRLTRVGPYSSHAVLNAVLLF